MGPTPGRFLVGCSGWDYPGWRGDFYPASLARTDWFRHYRGRFSTVEINSTFYGLPAAETVRRWRRQAPAGFVYAVKASRYLTHLKRLREPEAPLATLLDRVRGLGPRLGPVLYQLPPRWKADVGRLRAFVATLPRRGRHVVEVRDRSWYCEAVFAVLDGADVALCLHDHPAAPSPRVLVGPFLYLRFHGTSPRYGGAYGGRRLSAVARWLAPHVRAGRNAYVYFNNDVGGHAPRDAAILQRLVDGRL